ncbi:MAG: hypothetical protein ABI072_10325 [Edaphobacter sp.]
MKKKSLGKLSPEQLRRAVKLADEHPTLEGVSSLLASRPHFLRIVDEAGAVFQWAWAYELSIAELIALIAWVLDEHDELVAMLQSDDPQEEMLSLAEREDVEVGEEPLPDWRKLLGLELLIALIKCFESYRSYSQSLCDLVAKAGQGNREALLKAVRIDPSVLASPSIAEQVSFAVFHSDKKFLKQIKGAYATPRRKLAMYSDLRLVEALLHEADAFSEAPSEHIYDVVVNRMGLYDHRGEDARKGLMTLFSRWRGSATT